MQDRIESPAGEMPARDPYVRRPVVVPPKWATYNYRAVRAVWLIGGVVAALIAIHFALKLLGASTFAGFTNLIYSITAPLIAPFVGIFPTPASSGYIFEAASLVAIAIYVLLTWGLATLMKITTTSRGAQTPVE